MSVGHLLQGYVMRVEGLRRVKLLLGVNHSRHVAVGAQCHPPTLPLRQRDKDGIELNSFICRIYTQTGNMRGFISGSGVC